MSSNQTEPPPQKWRSIFDLPHDFFDSSRLYNHHQQDRSSSSFTPLDSLQALSTAITGEKEETEHNKTSSVVPRLSCNTCKVEFESLLDQRAHFSSDFHRFNVKLTMVGKNIIEEEDFDESASDSLFRDNDISSISGSEDESEKASFPSWDSYKKAGLTDKQKLFINLHNGDLVSFWKCVLISEYESISHDKNEVVTERHSGNLSYLNENELFERLKSLIQEPRDKSKLRIVLLATGGHFAGCVFDGNSVVAHKTFHRYVVRAKAGKKQSSKDASGKAASSAGASLRRYNEIALKKEIQELMSAWKPYFDASSCVFVHAPSDNRQLLYNSENAYFNHSRSTIRHVPFTVRRPTFKEARRIYNQLTSIMYEVVERTDLTGNNDVSVLLASKEASDKLVKEGKLDDSLPSKETAVECHVIENSDCVTLTSDLIRTTTPLHEAAKSGNTQQTLELLEQGLDPCILDERGRTPYMLANDKEVRNTFRRFMALNLDKWDWHAAKVPSPLTKEMEESQAAKQAEKDAKRKAKAKELKKLRKTKEKAQAQATLAQNASQNQSAVPGPIAKAQAQSSKGPKLSKEEELKRAQEEEREKRAAAAERRMAAAAALNTTTRNVEASNSEPARGSINEISCSCCNASLAGKVPFHRYNYNYCSTSCMHVHREILEDG